jgi:hypothetical protein
MTGDEMRDARATLGERWGFGRPLKGSELGRAMRLRGRDPGASVRDYERGVTDISGPISALIDMFLAGAMPPDGVEAIKSYRA